MGLDMYLKARRFLWSYPEDGPDAVLSRKIAELLGDPDKKVQYVECEAAYWRKANAIHAWFVNNCQNGEDDCETYSVDREQLEELLGLVNKVLADHSLAKALLPCADGFFFGTTNYGNWYFDNLKRTKEQIEDCLSPRYDGWDFQYESSW